MGSVRLHVEETRQRGVSDNLENGNVLRTWPRLLHMRNLTIAAVVAPDVASNQLMNTVSKQENIV